MINREELAWAAGFFDGEGSFYADRNGVRAALAQSHSPELLFRFGEALQQIGYVRGPYKYRDRRFRYEWRAHDFEWVQATIAMLWPWLGTAKREQALSVLEHFKKNGTRPKGRRPHGGRPMIPLHRPVRSTTQRSRS